MYFRAKKEAKRLFLHIGMNKTGTSAIQHVLSEQHCVLERQGLLYPKTGRQSDAHYGISAEMGFYQGKPQRDRKVGARRNLIDQLKSEIKKSSAQDVVISSEFFVIPRDVRVVQKTLAEFDCYILVYLRRHDHWWAAAYNQAVKTTVNPPWGRGFEAFLHYQRKLHPRYGDYRNLLGRWERVFGREKLIVRPYEGQQNQPNLVADFLVSLGREDLVTAVNRVIPDVNVSLGISELNLIDIFQRAAIPQSDRDRLIEAVIKKASGGINEDLASPQLRRKLVEDNADDYGFIARKYLQRDDGVLFRDSLPEPDALWQSPPQPLYREIVETVVKALKA